MKKLSDNHNGTSQQDSGQQLEQQILAAILHDSTVITKEYETLLLTKLSEPTKSIITKIIDYQQKTGESCNKLKS